MTYPLLLISVSYSRCPSNSNSSRIRYDLILSAASVLPIEDIVGWAHCFGAKVLVDACQSVPHMVVDVQALDADFLVASSHKVRPFSY